MTPCHIRLIRSALTSAWLLLAIPGSLEAQEVVELHVSPELLTLEIGQSERLFFTAFDSRGNIADKPVIRLGTSNALVAKVEPDGTVTGVAPGVAVLVVTAGKGTARVRVSVGGVAAGEANVVAAGHELMGDTLSQASPALHETPAILDSPTRQVLVSPPPSPDPVELSVGESKRFSVRPVGSNYTAATLATWSLTDSAVAQFDVLSGALRALAPGTTDLIASVEGLPDLKWRITVASLDLVLAPDALTLVPGQARSLAASLVNGGGRPVGSHVAGRWSSSDSSVVAVDSSGQIRGTGLGNATVTLSSIDGVTASASVAVVGDLLLSGKGILGSGAGIYQMSLEGQALEPVLIDSATNLYAVRSPDRSAITFASDASGRYQVYRIEPDGGDPERLTEGEAHNTQPVWTPDGAAILFTSTRTGTPQIFEMAVDGSGVKQLTRDEEPSHSPALSLDGDTVAFVRGRGNDERVFLMSRAGDIIGPARLGEPGRPERSPHFFPNGDLAAVVRIGTRATAVMRWDRKHDRRLPMVTSDDAIRDFAISRDGRFLVVVVESSARSGGSPTEVLLVDVARSKSTPLALNLPPGARVVSPSF